MKRTPGQQLQRSERSAHRASSASCRSAEDPSFNGMERNVADDHERLLAERQARRAEAELASAHEACAGLRRLVVVQALQLSGAKAARVYEPLRTVGESALELNTAAHTGTRKDATCDPEQKQGSMSSPSSAASAGLKHQRHSSSAFATVLGGSGSLNADMLRSGPTGQHRLVMTGDKAGTSPSSPTHRSVWGSVFHPGRNANMPRGNSRFDTVEPGSPSTWEQHLRSEQNASRPYSGGSGASTPSRTSLDATSPKVVDISKLDAVIQSRFAANDGKLSYSEFAEVMRRLSS